MVQSACLGLPFAAPAAARLPFLRGVNFTAEGRNGYTSEVASPMLDKLMACGVNAVALVPYGFHRPGTQGIRYNMGMEADDRIRDVAGAVRKAGMNLLLKPQLWTPGVFTGDLDFTADADRTAWFTEYTAFATHHAALAKSIGADLFCIANEFGKLSRHEAYWRGLIGTVRRTYSGPLVYAASQGPEFENLRFWDALDYIGLNNYYPLKPDFSAAHLPGIVDKVWSKVRKPVLFTECGYSTFENPHLQPWDESPRKLSPEHQAKAYDALLQAVYDKPWLGGMFWWKVGTNGYGGLTDGSHTPWNKPAMDVVRRWYRSGKR